MVKAYMDKVRAFLDKWYHRLQGHVAVTVVDDNNVVRSGWALDVYHIPPQSLWVADMTNGSTWVMFSTDDVTIG